MDARTVKSNGKEHKRSCVCVCKYNMECVESVEPR